MRDELPGQCAERQQRSERQESAPTTAVGVRSNAAPRRQPSACFIDFVHVVVCPVVWNAVEASHVRRGGEPLRHASQRRSARLQQRLCLRSDDVYA